jgi:nucleoside-diphosphate-sugar epimerase
MADLAHRIANQLGRRIKLVPGPIQAGSTLRRCPAIDKLAKLGYRQKVTLDQGLAMTCSWYFENQRMSA